MSRRRSNRDVVITASALSVTLATFAALFCCSNPYGLGVLWNALRGPPKEPPFLFMQWNPYHDWGPGWSPTTSFKDDEDVSAMADPVNNILVVFTVTGDDDWGINSPGHGEIELRSNTAVAVTVTRADADRLLWVTNDCLTAFSLPAGVADLVYLPYDAYESGDSNEPILDVLMSYYDGPDEACLEQLVADFRNSHPGNTGD